ncbi:MAG: choice-of-anchor Q domain-containing protein [Dokdonella sp.]|uniref:choice-of-anchor Q domain-containing protein n=1 Tax=Dokdonella sp. TaxID=2291710 RepID=UPI003F7E70F0
MFRTARAFVLCFTLALPGLGHAFSACVGTAEELDAAMSQAGTSTDASITIKIREGTYQAGSGNSFYVTLAHSNQTVSISGGWSGAACENRRLGASGTVLVGTQGSAALQLHTGFATNGNTINATDLTLVNTQGILNTDVGACLHVGLNPGATARVYRLRLDSCFGASAAILDNAGGDLTFANSVVQGGYNSAAPVRSHSNNAVTRLVHLTITGNTTTSTGQEASGLSIVADPGQLSQVTLDNSVVWGGIAPDGIPDIITNGPGIVFTRAHYDTRAHLNAVITDNVPSHGDPGFLTPTNPRLRADSPLVDSGAATGIGGTSDVEGEARTQGAAADVGAYETNPDRIHADGFDQ